MIKCDKCGFGHKTFEEMNACKSWKEMQAEKAAEERQPNTELRGTATEIIDVCEGQHTIGHLKSVERVLNAFAASIREEAQQQIEELKRELYGTPDNVVWSKQQWIDNAKYWNESCVTAWAERDRSWAKCDELEKQLAEARIELEAAEQRGDEYKAAWAEIHNRFCGENGEPCQVCRLKAEREAEEGK